MKVSQKNLPLTIDTPFGKDKVKVISITGNEKVFGLFQYNLMMNSLDNNLSFEKIIGKNVSIKLNLENGEKEYFNGIVSKFKQLDSDVNNTNYYAEIVPKLWLLNLNRDCRIYQNQSTPEIIASILKENKISDFKNDLKSKYVKREYCVQYQESDLAFITRLMSDEGIFYFFEHDSSGKHILKLIDSSSSYLDCKINKIRVLKATGGPIEGDTISECSLEQMIGAEEYVLGDYDYDKPSTSLMIKSLSNFKPNSNMKIFDYPGGYDNRQNGEIKAKIRMEEIEFNRKLFKGKGYCRAFRSGHKFILRDHERKDINTEYVLNEVQYSISQNNYSNIFSAFSYLNKFRPNRLMDIPIISGTQTAIVVGPKGEEIYTDKLGRVKVQFHWDRKGKKDEKSSCWVRVTQNLAGQGWGECFVPRVNQEVVVSFINGNPDKPLVTGAVYNGINKLPLNLPVESTKSTIKTNSSKGGKGFNQILFEDKAKKEEFYLQAQKDMRILIKNDCSREVLNDEKHKVTNNRFITVVKGDETIEISKGKRFLTVANNEKHINKKDFVHKVSGNYTLDVSGNLTIKVGGNINIQSGKSITEKAGAGIICTAGTSFTNKAGASLTNKAATITNDASANITNKGGAINSVEGGAMVKVKGGIIKLN